MSLSQKHISFCEEYLACWNATEAYCRVYPKAKRSSAWRNSSDLLRKTEVQDYINERMAEKKMTADEVMARLSDQARASHEPFIKITDDGFVYFDFSNPDAQNYLHLIKKIKTKRQRRVDGKGDDAEVWEDEWVEVELHDSQRALELIGKHHKLFTDSVEWVHTLHVKGLNDMLDKIYGSNNDSG